MRPPPEPTYASWGEATKAYRDSKLHVPWKPEQYDPKNYR